MDTPLNRLVKLATTIAPNVRVVQQALNTAESGKLTPEQEAEIRAIQARVTANDANNLVEDSIATRQPVRPATVRDLLLKDKDSIDALNGYMAQNRHGFRLAGGNMNALSQHIADDNLSHITAKGSDGSEKTLYKHDRDTMPSFGTVGALQGLHNLPGSAVRTTYAPVMLGAAAAAPLIGLAGGALGDAGALRGGLRGAGATVGGLTGAALGSNLADSIGQNEKVKNLSPKLQAAITLASVLGGTAGGGYLGYRGAKALSSSDEEDRKKRVEKAQEKSASVRERVSYIDQLLARLN